MACNLITNKAKSLKSLLDKDIIDSNNNVLKESEFINDNVETTRDMENIIGSKIPNDVFAFGVESNIASPNIELFRRADAAEGIIYPENVQYKNNFAYPIQENKANNLNTKLTDLLKEIGVTVKSITEDHRQKDIKGIADTFNKVVYAALNPTEVSTLPEEGAHMFVEFIEENQPALFNKMMADIPKYGLYKQVKEEYLPIYNDINKVKKEAIGKAISEYIVGNKIDPNTNSLREWFNRVLAALKNALSKFGINTEEDYNNYFEYTADKILKGDFKGSFQGSGQYFNTGEEANSPLKKIDLINSQLELRPVMKNGVQTDAYFFNGEQVKYRVTEKIKKDKSIPNTTPTAESLIGSQYGRRGHEDLMNLWKIKTGEISSHTVIPKTSNIVFARLSTFVDIVYNQFPGAQIRTEVKIYDPKTKTAGTIDLLITEPDGTVNILDYKFLEKRQKYIQEQHEKQLGEYKKILRNNYGFTKFGQMRIIPFQTKYSGTGENKVVTDIDHGTNTFEELDERRHLNPLPASFELTRDDRINRTLQYLNEELIRNKNATASNDYEQEQKRIRNAAIKKTISKLQITRDITALEDIAEADIEKMEFILQKDNPTPNELIDLYNLKEYYKDFKSKRYNLDSQGNEHELLTQISDLAQLNSISVDEKLETFFNENDIDTSKANKPLSKWNYLTQLSDYDHPVFQAFQRILNKAFGKTEIKVKKEYETISSIIDQIRKETGMSGVNMYDPILQKDKNGKPTNKLINRVKREWFDMHKSTYADPKLRNNLNKYFNTAAWNEFYKPLEKDFIEKNKGLRGQFNRQGNDKLDVALKDFKDSLDKSRGLGNRFSEYYTIPDEFLNEDYLKYIKNAPDSGLAKLYNKYMEVNQFAKNNVDSNIPYNLLPYVKKSTMEMMMNSGFNLKNLTNNALDKLKSYEWETYEIDSNGQRIYKIPLKYKGTKDNLQEDQSFDLGEMLMLWTESVYHNSHLQEIDTTSKLFEVALRKSKQISLNSKGQPILENGELRTTTTSTETVDQYKEYLHMYINGVTNEDADFDVLGFSGQKVVKTAMTYLSGTTIGLNVFSGFANLMGSTAQVISLAAKGNQFNYRDVGRTISNIADPKMRGLISLMDVTNNSFKKEQAINLSANQSERFVTWDKLYILQQGGDWLIQNSILGAMSQNYTVKEGKIVKKTKEDKSLLESLNLDKDGKVYIEGLDLNNETDYLELLKFREKVRRIGAEATGNVSEQDKFLAANTLKGQLFLQYRRWILPMGTSRFGNLGYNQNLEEYQVGKYRSTWETLVNKKIFNVVGELIKEQNSPTFEDIIQRKYEEKLLLNPNLEFEEFRKLYINNMRSTFVEVALLALAYGFIQGFKDDDDSNDNIVEKIFVRGMVRTANELSFWYNPDSFTSILKTPFPILGLITNLTGLMSNGVGEIFSTVFDSKDKDRKLDEKASRLVPGFSSYYRLLSEIGEDE